MKLSQIRIWRGCAALSLLVIAGGAGGVGRGNYYENAKFEFGKFARDQVDCHAQQIALAMTKWREFEINKVLPPAVIASQIAS